MTDPAIQHQSAQNAVLIRPGRRHEIALLAGSGILSGLLLAGCAIGPRYKQPEAGAPAAFRGDTRPGTTNSFADLPWWEVFQDDTLQGIIRTALTNNYDLRIAATRVEQAHALAAEARSQFFPLVGYVGTAARGKNASSSGVPSFNNGVTVDTYALAGAASWEVDLWGRIRRLNESARAQYLASQEARHDVTISVISQTAQAYLQMRALDEELEIARRATNSYGGSLKLFSDRLQGGVASQLETSSAEALQAAAAATIPELERQIAVQENLISVLLGQNPGPVARTGAPLENLPPPEVPAGLPSALLARRPDVREAEQLLRSANAQVGVAEASFLPQINLTALFGQVSPALSTFTAGGANAWNLAATLSGPIFQGGQLAAQYRQVKAAWEQARLQYQATVLNAFQEVSDALVARQKFSEERVEQSRAVDAYRVATKVAMERYQQGHANYYEVLQEQQLLFPAENTLVLTKLNQLLAVVQLYRALGGGWTPEAQ
jgi:multidrug efflux system outer membrane protein